MAMSSPRPSRLRHRRFLLQVIDIYDCERGFVRSGRCLGHSRCCYHSCNPDGYNPDCSCELTRVRPLQHDPSA